MPNEPHHRCGLLRGRLKQIVMKVVLLAAAILVSVGLLLRLRGHPAWPTLPHVRLPRGTNSTSEDPLQSVCLRQHSAFLTRASVAARQWLDRPPITDSQWRALLREPSLAETQTRAAVAVVDGHVYLTRPNEGVPLESRHEWLRGMLAQLVATARATRVPNVEFILSTSDWPAAPFDRRDINNYFDYVPVLGVVQAAEAPGGTPAAWDIAVPNGVFVLPVHDGVPYSTFARRLLDGQHRPAPWHTRRDIAFFRGTLRGKHSDCSTQSRGVIACLAERHPRDFDVALSVEDSDESCIASVPCNLTTVYKRTSLAEHSGARYLLQLDGHTYSYRLQALLALGSTVLRQASKFSEFYEPLLEPGMQYLPFDTCVSMEACNVADALADARRDEARSAAVAAAGFHFAHTQLAPITGRLCFWAALLAALEPALPPPRTASLRAGWQLVEDAHLPPPTDEDLEVLAGSLLLKH
jgi:hypothetical protein